MSRRGAALLRVTAAGRGPGSAIVSDGERALSGLGDGSQRGGRVEREGAGRGERLMSFAETAQRQERDRKVPHLHTPALLARRSNSKGLAFRIPNWPCGSGYRSEKRWPVGLTQKRCLSAIARVLE